MKKLSYDYVKKYIESFGFKLISSEYKNATSKLKIQCKKGHIFERTYIKFKQTQNCPICNRTKKLTIEEVKSYVENIGYELLSNEYKNNESKLKVRCDESHEFYTTYGRLSQGKRCEICSRKKASQKRKFSLKYVKNYVESFGYELLSEEYKGCADKLKLRCPKGHIFYKSFSKFKSGQRCTICSNKNRFDKLKLSFDDVKKYIMSFGYILLSEEYINNHSKLKIKCPNNHIFNMAYNDFKSGRRCPTCANINTSNRMKHDYFYVKSYVEILGLKLLSKEYQNNYDELKIKCDKGHVFYKSFSNLKSYPNCPLCNKKYKGEDYIADFLESNSIKYISQYRFNDCKFKKKLSFDFYLPDYNILIEYDGRQHYEVVDHFGGFDGFVDTKIRDTVKNIYCKDNNIKLIRIPYWEFDNIENIIVTEINKLHKIS